MFIYTNNHNNASTQKNSIKFIIRSKVVRQALHRALLTDDVTVTLY